MAENAGSIGGITTCPHCLREFPAEKAALLRNCPVCRRPFGVDPEQFALRGANRAERFRNPKTGQEEVIGPAWLWALLLGPIYLAHRGLWAHAVGGAILAIATAGLSWLFYPLFIKRILRNHYLSRGWIPVV